MQLTNQNNLLNFLSCLKIKKIFFGYIILFLGLQFSQDGLVKPLELPPVSEKTQIVAGQPLYLGSCNATDADSNTENNRIYYKLIGKCYRCTKRKSNTVTTIYYC
jgi:hypothetical protein